MKTNILLLFLSLLVTTSCLQKGKPFKIYWIHLEGAPVKVLFDNWIQPLKKSEKSFRFHNQEWTFPQTFTERSIPLLKNWISIRGLETNSPHLKESREDWLGFLQKLESKVIISTQNERLEKIYKNFLPKAKSINSYKEGEKDNRPLSFLSKDWKKAMKKETPIHLTVLNNTGNLPLYFADIQELRAKQTEEYNLFYQNLLHELSLFVKELKRTRSFDHSIILITSDRQKIINGQELVTTWEGLNFSVISNLIVGPYQVGHIQKSHPKYEDSFPGTWGVGVDGWTTDHFQKLIEDLLNAKDYNSSQNPWFHVRKNNLTSKLKWGQIL